MPNTAEAAAFLPAIEALRLDLVSLEHRAADVRALLERLCAHAGIAGEPAAAPAPAPGKPAPPSSVRKDASKSEEKVLTKAPATGSAATKARRANEDLRKKSAQSAEKVRTGSAETKAELGVSKRPAKPNDDKASAAELSKVVAAIAGASAEVQSAKRDKDFEKLKTAIAAGAGAERRAGELLIALAGRVRLLPGISKPQSKKYRRDAELSAEEFEAKMRRAQRRALAEVGAPFAMLDAIGAAPAKPQGARPTHAAPPHPRMKLTPFEEAPDGTLTRFLTAEVDGEGVPS